MPNASYTKPLCASKNKTIEMTFWNKLFGKEQNEKPEKNEEKKNQNEKSPIVEKYITGLKSAYVQNNGQEEWESFEQVIHGAKKEDINKLKRIYLDIPNH